MSGSLPEIDVNLFVFNSVRQVGASIESVLAQSWPAIRLTLIDDGSTDGTAEVLAGYADRCPNVRVVRNRCNNGAIANFQRAFWLGDADFVLPKSGDDILAPDFVAKIMDVMLRHPECAMCHARGLIFSGEAEIHSLYPPEHSLSATGSDALARTRHVMERYTSSPAFWGVYRRDAADRLARIRYRAGWDHALLAELALYGEIRHVPEPLYWRRDGGKPLPRLARAATERGSRGLDVDDSATEPHWLMPLTMTAFAHLETFAVARLGAQDRAALFGMVPEIFRARWLPAMRQEAAALRVAVPTLLTRLEQVRPAERGWFIRNLADLLHAARMILPDEDFAGLRQALDDVQGRPRMLEEAA